MRLYMAGGAQDIFLESLENFKNISKKFHPGGFQWKLKNLPQCQKKNTFSAVLKHVKSHVRKKEKNGFPKVQKSKLLQLPQYSASGSEKLGPSQDYFGVFSVVVFGYGYLGLRRNRFLAYERFFSRFQPPANEIFQ